MTPRVLFPHNTSAARFHKAAPPVQFSYLIRPFHFEISRPSETESNHPPRWQRQLSMLPQSTPVIVPAFNVRVRPRQRAHALLFRLCRNGSGLAGAGAHRYQAGALSRITSPGFLSSRKPMNTGARNFPSRVHSANLISATNFGLIQCVFFIIEGVMPNTHWPFCFDGRSTNAQSARSSARNFLCNATNDFVVNPVPTLPANTRSRSL